jgi:hypothetical protein
VNYNENDMSTREYWDRRNAKMKAEAEADRKYAASPEGQLRAAERELRAMQHMQRDHGGCTDEQIAEQRSKVAALRSEIRAAKDARFLAEWTLEVTKARRAEWNAWVRAQGNSISGHKVAQRERQQGWMFVSLKKAIQLHQL